MVEGAHRGQWWHTASLMAWIGDCIGRALNGKQHKSIDPSKLNPFTKVDELRASAAGTSSGDEAGVFKE